MELEVRNGRMKMDYGKEILEIYNRMQEQVDSMNLMSDTITLQSKRIDLLSARIKKLECVKETVG